MIPCPNCQQPVEILEKHLGTLFACPHCAAVYFINWEGQPELANHEQELAQESSVPDQNDGGFVPPFAVETPSYETSETNSFETPAAEFEAGGFEQAGFEQNPYEQQPVESQGFERPAYDVNQGYQSETPAEVPFEQSSEGESVAEHPPDGTFDFSQTLDQAPEPIVTPAVSDDSNFADVIQFANSDVTAGPLSYAVIIEGIESSQLVHALREAMADSRFGWDVADLLTHIGGGRLVLSGLTPAKASVLINRIKYLPFKISWRQDVLSGS